MRYIDADNILYKDLSEGRGVCWVTFRDWINEMPTVDAVEVVRCKDCRWGKEVCGNIECFADTNVPPEYHSYEWFCPNGEHR